MNGFWAGLWELVKVAVSTFLAFMAGDLNARRNQMLAGAEEQIKELKTDAKTRDDVAGLSHDQRLDELRNTPKPR